MRTPLTAQRISLLAGVLLALLAGSCLDKPEDAISVGDDDENDDATEDPWDDPIWNGDDDDSAVPGQLGVVSFSYNFVVTGSEYWDCRRSYRWIEQAQEPASGCADCLTTWRVKYELSEDSCGLWGYDGDGYELSTGLDPVGNWLWFSHDEGANWLRFPGQGTILDGEFTASSTFEGECFDVNSDDECDPGSEMSYRELFELNL